MTRCGNIARFRVRNHKNGSSNKFTVVLIVAYAAFIAFRTIGLFTMRMFGFRNTEMRRLTSKGRRQLNISTRVPHTLRQYPTSLKILLVWRQCATIMIPLETV